MSAAGANPDARVGDIYYDAIGDDGYVCIGQEHVCDKVTLAQWSWACKGNPLTKPDAVVRVLAAAGLPQIGGEHPNEIARRVAALHPRCELREDCVRPAPTCEKCGSTGLTRVGTQGVSKCETLCQECARVRARLTTPAPQRPSPAPLRIKAPLGGFRSVFCGAMSTAAAVGSAVALAPETMTVEDVGRSLVVLCGALFGVCIWALTHKEAS